MKFFALLALAAPLVSAMGITSPAINSTVTKGSDYSLTWSTVDTDPSTFSIYLVNFVNWPPSYVPLATDVETSSGSTKVHIPCSTDASYGYQFNAINGTNVYVIYAQSTKFSIGGKECVDPVKPPFANDTTTCAKETTTVTVTVSGSSSPLSGTGTGASTTSVPILNPSFSPTLIVDEFPTSFGTVPNTIGWSSGYENPVTLTSVPCAGQPSITVPPMMEPTPAPVEDVTITVYNTVVVEGDCGCQ